MKRSNRVWERSGRVLEGLGMERSGKCSGEVREGPGSDPGRVQKRVQKGVRGESRRGSRKESRRESRRRSRRVSTRGSKRESKRGSKRESRREYGRRIGSRRKDPGTVREKSGRRFCEKWCVSCRFSYVFPKNT